MVIVLISFLASLLIVGYGFRCEVISQRKFEKKTEEDYLKSLRKVSERIDKLNGLIIQCSELQPTGTDTKQEIEQFIFDLSEKIQTLENSLSRIQSEEGMSFFGVGLVDAKASQFYRRYEAALKVLTKKISL